MLVFRSKIVLKKLNKQNPDQNFVNCFRVGWAWGEVFIFNLSGAEIGAIRAGPEKTGLCRAQTHLQFRNCNSSF